MSNGWIGVDLDGTLAEYHGWVNPTHIGAPIPKMVERVKKWLAEGIEVKIFTARAYPGPYEEQHPGVVQRAIEGWCRANIGRVLEITYMKDYNMIELYDDRAITVEANTGRLLSPSQKRFH